MLVGILTTNTNYVAIAIINGSDKSDLTLHMCNNTGVDNYVGVKYVSKDGNSINIFPERFPIRMDDTFTVPFKITLKMGDEIQVKSVTAGVEISLIK